MQAIDERKPNIGLTTWKNAPDGKILQSDVTVSKNNLDCTELSGLNSIVNMYLDYAEKIGELSSDKLRII
ncbi:MAG: virulence RhuM family protein [Firmicutes bacterium]|nr:virulence RhuM family protein [Bacillota bacterium]